jgi:hypothetical protein
MTPRNKYWVIIWTLTALSLASACDARLSASRLKVDDGGTSVGGGGDPIYYYLEVTRRKLNDVLGKFHQTPEAVTEACAAPGLRPGAQEFCRQFITATLDQFAALNRGDAHTKFILTSDPLLVEGPDGHLIEVVARTPYGARGEIEFNRPLLSRLGPQQVLQLLTHEFGHKVTYNDQIVRDNDPIGPYATGREFLDELGSAFVFTAVKNGMIGRQFGVMDTFSCMVYGNGEYPSQHAYTRYRIFKGDSLKSYEAGFGVTGERADPVLLLPDGELSLRFMIHDEDSCAETREAITRRRTEYAVVKTTVDPRGRPEEEILASREIAGFNPLCFAESEGQFIEWDRFRFICSYVETIGTTQPPISKN